MERGGVWNEAMTLGMYWFTCIIKMKIHYPNSVAPSPGVVFHVRDVWHCLMMFLIFTVEKQLCWNLLKEGRSSKPSPLSKSYPVLRGQEDLYKWFSLLIKHCCTHDLWVVKTLPEEVLSMKGMSYVSTCWAVCVVINKSTFLILFFFLVKLYLEKKVIHGREKSQISWK